MYVYVYARTYRHMYETYMDTYKYINRPEHRYADTDI
jgi:hypothetical protein